MTRKAKETVKKPSVRLEPEADEVDAAWAAEVERRAVEIKQAVVRPILWADVKMKARKLVRDRG
jgi:hypothetical protein